MRIRFILMLGLLSTSTFASMLPTQSDYYYKLGGDSDLYIPPVSHDQTVTLGGNIYTGGLSCSNFNPVLSITNTFNDLKSTVTGVPSGVIDNLKGSVAGFPMYKLQQSMPGLYNILQNTSMAAQNAFSLRVKECQQVQQELVDGNSPVYSMLSVSDSQGWIEAGRRAKKGEAVDIVNDAKEIAKHGDEYGIPWVHRQKGNSGGSKQTAINVISDVVVAGYNLMLTPSRDIDAKEAPNEKAAHANAFVRIWATPDAAAKWAVMVLGDIQVSVKQESKDATAGIGLSTLLQSCPKIASSTTCVTNVGSYLWQLVDKKIPANEENLRKITAANVLISEEIITAIQRMPREQQVLTVSKLSEEIAIQNLLDEAMSMRRLLQAGLQIQEVQNLKPALVMVQSAITKLDKEVSGLAFENEVRKKMMTDTLKLIMDLRTHDLAKSIPGDEHEQALVKNGAIYRNNDKKE